MRRAIGDNLLLELQLGPPAVFSIQQPALNDSKLPPNAFSVVVETAELDSPPPMLGEYRVDGARVEFRPRFPLSPSVKYRVLLSEGLLANLKAPPVAELLQFSLPTKTASAPQITAIYPSADELPENLLKFYIHFSKSMKRGDVYDRLHLFQGDKEVDEPFLELTEELWDARQTRFTLFIHPGRIKRGVQPRELRGPPLDDGKSYTLRIDGDWESADGARLGQAVEKQFLVTPAVHAQLDPLAWKIESPAAKTRQPVRLTFDRPLDEAMLGNSLLVKFKEDSSIAGTISLEASEYQWLFTPDLPWSVGAYRIEVETDLEDICGNNLAAPFEVKIENQIYETPAAKVAIEFIVK